MSTKPPKLTAAQQIEHLKGKGVKFERVSESDALEYLRTNNNYFKLRAYRKGFAKRNDGTYIDLDFGYLKDLSIIDMLLRYCLLRMCLDIEHFEKVWLLRCFDESCEDGYGIVEDFIQAEKGTAETAFSHALRSTYCKDIHQKYGEEMPIWAFVEILSFGSFVKFYRFCADRFQNKEMQAEWYRLMTIKSIRNAAAHSNCIINDLSPNTSKHSADTAVMQLLSKIGISKGIRKRKMSCEKLKQIATLFYVYDQRMPAEGVRSHRASEMDLELMLSRVEMIIQSCYQNYL